MKKAVGPAIRRLFDAQAHWHSALENYFIPGQFRRAINACIQELRNVTFVLQNNKHEIPKFDEWYPPWQEKMRKAKSLRWLVDARNKVVKQGDLELNSLLRVTVVGSYIESENPTLEIELTPSLTTEEIWSFVTSERVPKYILSDSYLKLERRWIDKDYQDEEILQVLGKCWSAIASLLEDAPEGTETVIGTQEIKSRLPPCMYQGSESRSLWLRVEGEELIPVHFSQTELNQIDYDEVRLRYSDAPMFQKPVQTNNFKETCEFFFQQAMFILSKDKYHIHLVLLFVDGNPAKLIQLNNEVRADKYRSMQLIASEVEAIGADSFIMIGEVWRAIFDPSTPICFPVDSPDRTEALSLIGATSDGQGVTLAAGFKREGDKIEFGVIERSGIQGFNLIAPILDIWNK
ncbi:MAG: hypothetical protein ACD_51C00260G0002 [uncultured bacterium]|nr:MAG: hypothetical protein ACD_51C00260G0002 [uncultured bacterium]